MELIVKHFRELTVDELWEIYKLRAAVFVVEQNCVYQDVDDYDSLSIIITAGWFIYLVIQVVKKKCNNKEKTFAVMLFCFILWQGCYIYQINHVSLAAVEASIESIDEQREEMVIRTGDGEKVTLKSPMLVNNMVETTGRKYLVTYTWHRDKRNEGKLQMISLIEENK